MSSKAPQSYADAVTAAQDLVRKGRLNDPGEHFPYKHDDAVEAGLPADIADASQRYIAAQQAYLESPGDGTRADYEAAKTELVAARQAHRIAENRPGTDLLVNTENVED